MRKYFSALGVILFFPSLLFSQSKIPIKFSGNLSLNLTSYSSNKLNPSRAPFSATLAGNTTLTGNGFALPFSFILSEQERKFEQPFNQFGASPKYKWVTVHLGYRNLTYSNYTLNGHTFLGAGVDLTPGKFRFSVMRGKFIRQVPGLFNPNDSTKTFEYRRIGYAVKIGVGSSTNYIDFCYFRATDDTIHSKFLGDTTGVHPEKNMVLGVTSHQQIAKKFDWIIDAAYSIHTRNIQTTLISDYVTNKNIPFKLINGIYPVQPTTSGYYAYESSLGYKEKYFSLRLAFKRVAPGFVSLGSYEIASDVQNITIQPSITVWKNKIHLNGSIGIQHDNLTQTKKSTSHRVIGSANGSIAPNKNFALQFNFSNYSTDQQPGIQKINDTLRLAQTSKQFSITPRYMIAGKKFQHLWLFIFLRQNLIDRNPLSTGNAEYETRNLNFTYNLGITEQKATLTASINSTNTKTYYGKTGLSGFTLGAGKVFLKNNSLNTNISFTENATKFNNASSGSVFNINASASYKLAKHHSVSFKLFFVNNHSTLSTIPSYHELTVTVGYVFSF